MVPDAGQIEEFREPIAKVNFILPADCIGTIMKLCEDRRGIYKSTEYLGPKRAQLVYELPLAEIIFDMYDKLKSVTRGYGTMDYEVIGFRPADLVQARHPGERQPGRCALDDRAPLERRQTRAGLW